eukprot:CAMPEP_0185770462 /NCGR_PEP_ID=MMETSP1174-20130828/59221_1 /TAXON_ID=35687 /ORGANISM="Dictyocha speculum, Strain CCMP1381" /LENGTH=329 /DNA_ID=CAMNT_0028455891 /DNA_START=38 /DNA_END=1027 /DNA_ORIENTATION=+
MPGRIQNCCFLVLALCLQQCHAGGSNAGGSDWRYFMAGGISAATSHGITTPIDVVKTRMQIDPTKYHGNVMLAAKDLVKTEGPLFLLQGLGPTVVGYGFEGALKFGFYEAFKPIFGNLTPNKLVNFFLASIVAGAVASIVLCPAEDVRIRLVSDPTFASGFIAAFMRLLKEEGLASTFTGLNAMLAKQIPYTAAKQVSFDFITAKFYALLKVMNREKTPSIAWTITLLSAAITSVFSCITSQPGDVILTETYKSEHGEKTTLDIINGINANGGLQNFFVGLNARLFHVCGIITSQLAIYDVVKQLLGLAATGAPILQPDHSDLRPNPES